MLKVIKRWNLVGITLTVIVLGLIGIYLINPSILGVGDMNDPEQSRSGETEWIGREIPDVMNEVVPKPIELSTWVVDWEWELGLKDLEAVAPNLASLQMFAAYFDQSANLLITDDFHERYEETVNKLSGEDVYLTVVNDRVYQDGTSIQKDPELITQLLENKESREHHINQIMSTVERYGFQGVEIDYEKIREDNWDRLIAFYSELYQHLDKSGRELRVVLEPSVPIENLSLPNGPVYVVMAYNLFGYHSGPGPKANISLISDIVEKLDHLKGDHYIALSAGGFDWQENGDVTGLTEQQAVALSVLSTSPPERDDESGVLYFNYQDDENIRHTVWYADLYTFSHWIEYAHAAGVHKIALWRLGGMQERTLDYLSTLE